MTSTPASSSAIVLYVSPNILERVSDPPVRSRSSPTTYSVLVGGVSVMEVAVSYSSLSIK